MGASIASRPDGGFEAATVVEVVARAGVLSCSWFVEIGHHICCSGGGSGRKKHGLSGFLQAQARSGVNEHPRHAVLEAAVAWMNLGVSGFLKRTFIPARTSTHAMPSWRLSTK